jgi:NAD kinase
MIKGYDKIVVVTKKTALEELIEQFNTIDQARFYIEHMGGSFDWYESAHQAYLSAVETLRRSMPPKYRSHWIERSFLPTFTFGPNDIVVTLGQDGLVVNTAKYLDEQPLLALNPDPERIDGVLIPFAVAEAREAIESALSRWLPIRRITMAEARLNDGRSILAVNDLFIGQKTHLSARYVLSHEGMGENQSSSGIIVSTGAGSTGWYRSILAGAAGVMAAFLDLPAIGQVKEDYRFDPESEQLVFNVREPFASRTSGAEIVHGVITPELPLTITSRMTRNGVIFSDGIEEDFLTFNSGSIATVGIADRKLRLIDRDRATHGGR